MQRECYWLLGKVLAQVNTPQSTATNPTSKRARGPAHHLAFLPLTFQAIIARSIRRRCLLPITSATLIQRGLSTSCPILDPPRCPVLRRILYLQFPVRHSVLPFAVTTAATSVAIPNNHSSCPTLMMAL